MNAYELVVLDLAGTTVIDDGLVEEAFTRAWDRVTSTDDGRSAAIAHVRATMGQSKIEVFRAIADETTAQAINRAFEGAYRELIDEGRCEAIPGAEETIRSLRAAGLKIAFTTGFSHQTADGILRALKWTDLVDAVLTPADVGRGRPAPDLNLTALIRTKTSSVAAMVCVGDTESDAGAGRASGAGLVVGVLTGSRTEEALRAAGADVVIASVADLPAELL
ncbi:MAG: phosphonatase-like hydrolase [Pseudolysinimonas sp.]|uniref:phosphonatase-like hydrolase n=1 Tax=Pseudolysinimonas sp. TaxID=2680009 RepID=UPI0032661F82